ncbi:MAG TPA: hypothetical protein DEP43_03050 [Ruminococcaceae bacterium]|nr:hypothetical protein [Oscillospiraceae bacterium]
MRKTKVSAVFKRAGGWCKSGSEAVRSTFQAAGEEPEGGTLYRTNKRPDRFVRQFGWQRGIFRPIGKGRKIPFFVLKEDFEK